MQTMAFGLLQQSATYWVASDNQNSLSHQSPDWKFQNLGVCRAVPLQEALGEELWHASPLRYNHGRRLLTGFPCPSLLGSGNRSVLTRHTALSGVIQVVGGNCQACPNPSTGAGTARLGQSWLLIPLNTDISPGVAGTAFPGDFICG